MPIADADRRGDAAEQRHGQDDDGFGEGELVGADIGEAAREQAAAETPQQRAQREGGHLGAVDVDASDAGGELVVAHRPHRAAEPGVRQTPDELADQRQHRNAKSEVDLRQANSAGRGMCARRPARG